jgi:hypothetical protein
MQTTLDSLDILDIDSKIRESFSKEKEKLSVYQERLEDLEKTYKNMQDGNSNKKEIEKKIKEIKESITNIQKNNNVYYYTMDTMELLENYKKLLKTPLKVSFLGKVSNDSPEKTDILEKYVKIAQKYYKLEIKQKENKFKMVCDNCPNKKYFAIEENSYICEDCGSQQERPQNNSTSYRDVDRVNISTKYTYDRKVHFRDCINQYQGKENCNINSKVYDSLESEFEKHHLLIGDSSTKKEKRFSKITKEHILMFLKELGFSKHYENVNLIHYTMTGKKPDDITYLEDKLLNDFDLLVETYDKHYKKKVSRVNFISTQYVLYQLLQKHKHPCKREDFLILKTVDRITFHDDICRELFLILNWSFVPLQ